MGEIDTIATNSYYEKWNSNYGNKEIDLDNDDLSGTNDITVLFSGYDFKWYPTTYDYVTIPNLTKDYIDGIVTPKRELGPMIGFIDWHQTTPYVWDLLNANDSIPMWNTITHVEKFGARDIGYDLNFETKQGVTGYVNSYTNFWESGMENIFNNNNRIITYYVKLNIDDIRNLDFKNIISIKGQLYYLQSVVADLNTERTSKVELIKAFDYEKYIEPFLYPFIYGTYDTGGYLPAGTGRPTANISLLDSGFSISVNTENPVVITTTADYSQYLWFATPATSSYNLRNYWIVDEWNRGDIGGDVDLGGNLFPDPVEVGYGGTTYYVYIANYQTNISYPTVTY